MEEEEVVVVVVMVVVVVVVGLTRKSCLDSIFFLQHIISKQDKNKEIHVVFVDSQRFMT